jgi:CBS domain-containing protein
MTRKVLAVRADCSLTTAMNAVLGSGHDHVVVVDADGVFRAILPAPLVATALMTRLAVPSQTLAALLTGETPRISPEASIHAAAAVMLDHEVDALGVVDVDGILIGLLTWSDIGRTVADRRRP